MSDKVTFGSYAAHQPQYEGFKQLGKLDDYIFQALAHMGNASWQMSWANTVLEDVNEVPAELKEKMRQVSTQFSNLQEELRSYK